MGKKRVLVTVLQELLLKQLDNGAFEKYCYRFEGTCKIMQGVNVQKVALLLLTIFNSSGKVVDVNPTRL